MKTLVICSGGLDSVSLAHKVAAEQTLTGLVSFDYGQRHSKELGLPRPAHNDLASRTRS
jgi:7-cyano-7-deazaguanine synthase